jgi:hypothetical protein
MNEEQQNPVELLNEHELPAYILHGLGQYYEHVAEIKRAINCYEMAAAQGHADSQYRLAFLYYTGRHGVPPEQKKPCCRSCRTNFDRDDYREYFLECGHSFCLSCLEKQNECPTCGLGG